MSEETSFEEAPRDSKVGFFGCMHRVESMVTTISTGVNALTLEMGKLLQREEDHKKTHTALEADVWGVSGDPQKPGLKGRMEKAEIRLDGHDSQFAKIDAKYWGGLGKLWTLATAAAIAALSACLGHWWK